MKDNNRENGQKTKLTRPMYEFKNDQKSFLKFVPKIDIEILNILSIYNYHQSAFVF